MSVAKYAAITGVAFAFGLPAWEVIRNENEKEAALEKARKAMKAHAEVARTSRTPIYNESMSEVTPTLSPKETPPTKEVPQKIVATAPRLEPVKPKVLTRRPWTPVGTAENPTITNPHESYEEVVDEDGTVVMRIKIFHHPNWAVVTLEFVPLPGGGYRDLGTGTFDGVCFENQTELRQLEAKYRERHRR